MSSRPVRFSFASEEERQQFEKYAAAKGMTLSELARVAVYQVREQDELGGIDMVGLDPDLKAEATAYAAVKGYGLAALVRVALVNIMARNGLTKGQQAKYDKLHGRLLEGGLRSSADATGDILDGASTTPEDTSSVS